MVYEVFRAVPQVKRITIEIVDMDKLDLDNIEVGSDLVENYKLPTKRVSYIGYVKGPGVPVPVEISVARVLAEYDDEFPKADDVADKTDNQRYYLYKRANTRVLRDWLIAVVRNLPEDVANSLLFDDTGDRILVALGWKSDPSITAPDDEVDDNPKGEENSETGN